MIRDEQPSDQASIRLVHTAAFPTPAEAALVDALRDAGHLAISLVAQRDATVVGHVAFSRVTVDHAPVSALGLAPVAVLPAFHRQGIGGELVRAGLERCRFLGVGFVVVLGDPGYYSRFGFMGAASKGLGNEYGAGDEFMVIELAPGSLPTGGGMVRYSAEFAVFA